MIAWVNKFLKYVFPRCFIPIFKSCFKKINLFLYEPSLLTLKNACSFKKSFLFLSKCSFLKKNCFSLSFFFFCFFLFLFFLKKSKKCSIFLKKSFNFFFFYHVGISFKKMIKEIFWMRKFSKRNIYFLKNHELFGTQTKKYIYI